MNGKQIPENPIAFIQGYIDNSLFEVANKMIKEWNLQIEIRDGRICDKMNSTEYWLHRFITVDPQTMAMKDDVRKLSKVDDEVLITGPTGCGKELIAHALMGDREGEFIAVNCAGLPDTLIESLLFGHMKGTFTGANDNRIGYCAAAKNGILFLDEIGELPLVLQAKLLRAIQEKVILPLGSNKEVEISCRFVFATNKNLYGMCQTNQFRLDLYARISTFEIRIKDINERKCDIEPIIRSIDGGLAYLNWAESHHKLESLHLAFGVRGLQQLVRRYKVLHQ